jgi:hypothetical protein
MAGKVNKSLMERLAVGAAEKRAYGFLYGNQGGGGRWGGGGYGGYGGGFGNPYMGGGGYGGYGGGGYGGMPMMGQSFAGPGGRGSYYGMDPRFSGTFQQMLQQQMGQQQQGFERGTLPGIDIGLQGQQQEVEANRQNAPAFQHARGLEGAVLQRDLADPDLVDPSKSSLVADIAAQREAMTRTQKAYDDAVAAGRGITQKYADPKTGLGQFESRLKKVSKGSWGRNVMMDALAEGDDDSVNAAYALKLIEEPKRLAGEDDEKFSQRRRAAAVAVGKKNTTGVGRGWRDFGWAPRGTEDWQDVQAALGERKIMQTAQTDEQTRHDQALAAAEQARTNATTKHNELLQRQQQAQQEYERVKKERAEQGGQRLQNVAGRAAGTISQTETNALRPPQRPGTLPNRPEPNEVPVTTPLPVPRPPAVLPPTPPLPPPTTGPLPPRPPTGGTGPRGPRQIKVASIVELAHNAARIHLEKRLFKQAAGLGDVVSRIQAAHAGRNAEMIGKATKNIAALSGPSTLPRVAATVKPKLDPMKVMGLESIPSSAAHLPVGSDMLKSMGISEGQHEMMRRALGLG